MITCLSSSETFFFFFCRCLKLWKCVNLCSNVGFVCAKCHNFLVCVCSVCSGRGEVNCGLPSVNGMSQARYLDWVINSGSRHSYSHCQTAELLTPRIPHSLSLMLSPLLLFNFHTARLPELSIYHHFPFSPCHSCLVLFFLLFSHSRSLQTRTFFYYIHELEMWRSSW